MNFSHYPAWLIALTFLTTACSPPASSQNVNQIFKQNCASCHGMELEGGSAASLLDDEWAGGSSDRDLYDAVWNGMKDLGMPAYQGGLTEPEAWATVVYIREKRYAKQRELEGNAKPNNGVYSTQYHDYRVETVIPGAPNFDRPWAIDFLPDGTPLVTERAGTLYLIRDGKLRPIDSTPDVWAKGQGGLLEVAVAPGDSGDGSPWVYLAYSVNTQRNRGEGNTAIARGRVDTNQLKWIDHEVIYRPDSKHDGGSGVHFGSRIVFDPDGEHLYFVVGERGVQQPAQSLKSPVGKVHRTKLDGSVPEGNPFPDSDQPTTWTLGHRNPQGLSMHPETGEMYAVEHGPRGGDEINRLEPGRNFGWPTVAYSINYNGQPFGEIAPFHEEAGFDEPVYYWLPSIAICGTAFYTGEQFPQWQNDLFVAALAKQEIHRVRFDESGDQVIEDEVLLRGIGRVRDVATGPDGALWVAVERPGRILKLVPAE
jgi:glucose/arabinose dehydrogenase